MSLYTMGYEGVDLDTFMKSLRRNDIRLLLDVRELPLSRKRGFSKVALSDALRAKGIIYRHIPTLGCPKPIRNNYKKDGDWKAYCKSFNQHLLSKMSDVAEVVNISREANSCLMCFEADFNLCHRNLIALAAVKLGAAPAMHLKWERDSPVELIRAVA